MQLLQGGQQRWRRRPLTRLLMPTGLYDVPQRLWHVSAAQPPQLLKSSGPSTEHIKTACGFTQASPRDMAAARTATAAVGIVCLKQAGQPVSGTCQCCLALL